MTKGLIDLIKKSLKTYAKNIEGIEEYSYELNIGGHTNKFYIDLLIQVNYMVCIFELKSGSKIRKAKKQLKFHKDTLLRNRLLFSISKKLEPFSEVKTFYVSEKNNFIVNLENEEECVFNPTFLQNPIKFLLS